MFRTIKVIFLFTTFDNLLGLFVKILSTPDQISLKATLVSKSAGIDKKALKSAF